MAVVALGAVGLCAAQAERLYLLAENNPGVPSAFVLSFGGEPPQESAGTITQTSMVVEINADAGMARIMEYTQVVEPLTLPGGISTGNLLVTVRSGSSAGTFNARLGTFETAEEYEIHFDGDLSAFGLTSPVTLPGSSAGVINFGDGEMSQQWVGVGFLPDPQNPGGFIGFDYTCSVNTVFVPQTACTGDINGDGLVNQSDLGELLAAFGTSTGDAMFNPYADWDGNGTVDQADLGVVLAAFGSGCE